MARNQVARVALVLLPAMAGGCASEAWSDTSQRLPDGPHFLKTDTSTRTVLAWQAVTNGQAGHFLLLRGSETGGLRVAAILPAFEGSHRYRYVDQEVPADTGTVYQLVYREGDGPELILITAHVDRPTLRSPDLAPSPARDAPLGRRVDPPFPLPSSAGDRLQQTAQRESDGWTEPLSPPPKPPTAS